MAPRLRFGRTAPVDARRSDAPDLDGQEQAQRILIALEDLRDMPVREVMTPRVDVVGLPIPVDASHLARAVRQSGHSTFPVYDDDLDNLVGVLYVHDLFRAGWEIDRSGLDAAAAPPETAGAAELAGATEAVGEPPERAGTLSETAGQPPMATGARSTTVPADGDRTAVSSPAATHLAAVTPPAAAAVPAETSPPAPATAGTGTGTGTGTGDRIQPTTIEEPSPVDISRRIRKPYLVPESRFVLDVLADMRHDRRAFAVVVDEYGGVAGIVTIKDLLGALVGDLRDELDRGAEPDFIRVDRSRWLVDGGVSVDDLRERLGIPVPEGDYVTLGGYLFDVSGHIPEEGEVIRAGGWDYRVVEMDRRRVAKVVVRAADEGPATSHEAEANGRA
ncbi:MAG: CBS domain-containing protein [Actinomycetota bacterium]|nr:CBS domain-containing protein [Actinomycetota bacterium]